MSFIVRALFLFITAIFVFSASSLASEIKLGTDARKDLSVAVYNTYLALVKDKRTVALKRGDNDVAFVDVSAQIKPETALVFGNGIAVKEQNFNFDLLTPSALLNKYLGRQIKVITTNPATGVEKTEDAVVLSTEGGNVLKIGNRIETDVKGRFVFPDIPQNLRDKPTLVLKLKSMYENNTDIELAYLTGGIGWQADYVAKLNSAENSVALNGWVTLTNFSGVSYDNALLQLVAGQVNQVQPVMQRTFATKAMAVNMAMEDSMPQEESFMDYHLYTLNERTSLLSNQTKQVALFGGANVAVNKEYRLENIIPFSGAGRRSAEIKFNPQVILTFVNSTKAGLGIPLPAGVFRVYKEDSSQKLLFVGEDRISHTPKDDDVKIKLGEAFDVVAKSKATDFKKMGDRSFEASFEVTLQNAKDTDVTVNIYQNFPIGYKILSENVKSIKESATGVLWKVKVPRNSSAVLKAQIFVAD